MFTHLPSIQLDSGGHAFDDPYGCVMEVVALLAGDKKWDNPRCVSRFITNVAIRLNDNLSDRRRQELLPLIPRILRAKRTSRDVQIEERLGKWVQAHCMSSGYEIDDIDVLEMEEVAGDIVESGCTSNFDPVMWFSDLLDAHEKAMAAEGVLLEDDFCAFAEGVSA